MSTSTAQPDNTIPARYMYSWFPGTAFPIEDFVAKYRPSMVQNDGTKPWIWVRRKENAESQSVKGEAAAVVEAAALLQQVTENVEQIKNNPSIPVHGSKKTGVLGKKEVREQAQAQAAEKLKDISRKHSFVCGKWLIFAQADKVDAIWSKIASSLVSGPLSSTSAFCAKVATSPENPTPGYQHVICVYIPNVYDKEDVIAVMTVLLRQHGLNLSGVKSDLYTIIGLDSKHPSGIPSTVWKNVSLMKDSEIKELKEAYYAEAARSVAAHLPKDSMPAQGKSKPLTKRKIEEDPFASDDETGFKGGKLAGIGEKKDQEIGSEGGWF